MGQVSRCSKQLNQLSLVSTENDRANGLVGLAKTRKQPALLPNRPTWVVEAHRHPQIVGDTARVVQPTPSDR